MIISDYRYSLDQAFAGVNETRIRPLHHTRYPRSVECSLPLGQPVMRGEMDDQRRARRDFRAEVEP